MHGELIKTVINDEYFTQGTYEFVWEGENNSGNQILNGVYFGVLSSTEQTNTLKLIITK
jgi:flagellar hook assembly protein FlgD